MDTVLHLRVTVSDDTLIGNANVIVFRTIADKMQESVRLWDGVAILPTLTESKSPYQWAITVLRDTTDRAVAQLLNVMSEGTEKPMLMHADQQET
jgi:hypothetical protein